MRDDPSVQILRDENETITLRPILPLRAPLATVTNSSTGSRATTGVTADRRDDTDDDADAPMPQGGPTRPDDDADAPPPQTGPTEHTTVARYDDADAPQPRTSPTTPATVAPVGAAAGRAARLEADSAKW